MHALRALTRLGLKDCFERIICFETLNPIGKGNSQNGDAILANKAKVPEIFDIMKYAAESNSNVILPMTPIVCKPFEDSFKLVFKIAEIDPARTVNMIWIFLVCSSSIPGNSVGIF